MNPEIQRQRADDIQRMKEALSKSANLRNLLLEDLEQQKALVNGIRKVPQNEVVQQAQYLEHQLLPQIESKRGRDTEDYKFFAGVLDSLNWLLHVTDYAIRLEERIVRMKHNNQYYKELSMRLERELDKYQTMESFLTKELIADYTNPEK